MKRKRCKKMNQELMRQNIQSAWTTFMKDDDMMNNTSMMYYFRSLLQNIENKLADFKNRFVY